MARMETQTTIVRDLANGFADGFMNDLAAGHIKLGTGENALYEAFTAYVAKCAGITPKETAA